MSMMAELSHLEEIITQLDKHTADPFSLPSSTEQVKQNNIFLKIKMKLNEKFNNCFM